MVSTMLQKTQVHVNRYVVGLHLLFVRTRHFHSSPESPGRQDARDVNPGNPSQTKSACLLSQAHARWALAPFAGYEQVSMHQLFQHMRTR